MTSLRKPAGGARRELLACAAAAVVLVVIRSLVFIEYEQLFDSDQAIVGLMAKHVSEFSAFPLFFYGQRYMLGVQAWFTAPFFWVGGPTVAMLKLPLVLINVVVVLLLIVMFVRNGGRPLLGLIASLPIVATSPVASGELLGAGAGIEPFLYVIALWMLRDRPVLFGALLCFGSLHREFTLLALPSVLVVKSIEGRPVRWPWVSRAGIAFAAAWAAFDFLNRTLSGRSIAGEASEIGRWLSFVGLHYRLRLYEMLTTGLADLLGLRPFLLANHRFPTMLEAGSWMAGAAFLGALAACAWRLATFARSDGRARIDGDGARVELGFCLYLALIAVLTWCVYGLNVRIDVGAPATLRYVLFTLLLPIALLRAFLQTESNRLWRGAVCVLIIFWAASNTRDHIRLAHDFRVAPPPSEHRILADYLTRHGIRYGWATYWDCYVVDFLARERVVLASTDVVRIPEYQALVDRNRMSSVTVRRWPCDEGTRVSTWCLVD